MTITSPYAPVNYNGSGSAGPFTFGFRLLDKSHIRIQKISAAGVVTNLTEGVAANQYSITLIAAGLSGAQVTLNTALAIGERLVGSRITPRTQEERLTNLGRFNAEIHEAAFDKATMIVQENEQIASSSLKFPVTDTPGLNQTLPVDSARANTLVGFDALGNVVTYIQDAISAVAAAASAVAAGASAVLAQAWAVTTGSLVSGTDYSAKEYAIGTTVPAGSAKYWSQQAALSVGSVKVTGADTTPAVLNTKLLVSTEFTKTVNNPGAAETITLALSSSVRTLFQQIAQNIRNADYTLALTDAGGHIYRSQADTTARNWTIPANASVAFPINSAVTFVNDGASGNVSIPITTDTLVMAGTGATGTRTLAPGGMATALKVTSTRWIISGVGLS